MDNYMVIRVYQKNIVIFVALEQILKSELAAPS